MKSAYGFCQFRKDGRTEEKTKDKSLWCHLQMALVSECLNRAFSCTFKYMVRIKIRISHRSVVYAVEISVIGLIQWSISLLQRLHGSRESRHTWLLDAFPTTVEFCVCACVFQYVMSNDFSFLAIRDPSH